MSDIAHAERTLGWEEEEGGGEGEAGGGFRVCWCVMPHMLEHVFSMCSPREWIAVYYMLYVHQSSPSHITETII